MKGYLPVILAAVTLGSSAAQPERPLMQDAQYKAIALSSLTGEQCAIDGMMDIDLAAAHGQMLEERTAEFQFDPARMQAQRQQAAAEVMHTQAVTQSACDALAYEVLRAQAQRRVADRAGQKRKRLALQLMKQQRGEAVP